MDVAACKVEDVCQTYRSSFVYNHICDAFISWRVNVDTQHDKARCLQQSAPSLRTTRLLEVNLSWSKLPSGKCEPNQYLCISRSLHAGEEGPRYYQMINAFVRWFRKRR